MEVNMSQINLIEAMLNALFDRAKNTKAHISCCSCFVDHRKYIVAMALSNSSFTNIFIYNTENDTYFIVTKNSNEEWNEVDRRISDFFDCSNQSKLTVSEYAEYWYSRIEPDSNIISNSIKQKRSFFICCYPETFEDHYNLMDETGEIVLLITEFSDDFSSVHFYVHFLDTGTAFLLGGDTNSTELLDKIYDQFCEYQEELQIREREELNRFYPQDKYSASDFTQVKAEFRKAIGNAFKSDIGIYNFRFRTDAGNYATSAVVVSSELCEVRVMIHNIDTNQTFSRPVSDSQFFDEIFAIDLFIELFPSEAHAIYREKRFDPKFEKIKEQITDILDKARQGSPSSCSFCAVNKDIPALAEEYTADAVLEQNCNLIHLNVYCPFEKNLSYKQTVEVGKPYDEILRKLYRFLYPNRITLSIEDIPTE